MARKPKQQPKAVSKPKTAAITIPEPSTEPKEPPAQDNTRKSLFWIGTMAGGAVIVNIAYEKYAEGVPDWLFVLFVLIWFFSFGYYLWTNPKVKEYRRLIYTYPAMSLVVMVLVGAFVGGIIAALLWLSIYKQPASASSQIVKPKSNIQKMSDAELKSEVAAFVKSLHQFDQKMRAAEPDLFYQKVKDLRAAKTEEEKRRVTERYFELEGRTRISWTQQRINEYNQQYYTRAEELRDEMYRRIPPKNLDGIKPVPYNGLPGANPIGEIASNLEKLSNLIPD